jgi:hypothetical protein
MRFLRPEYVPLVIAVLAFGQMAYMADQGTIQLSFEVAGLLSFFSLASGVGLFLYPRTRDVTAARIAFATGILFFVLLFGAGEYLFAAYFPA